MQARNAVIVTSNVALFTVKHYQREKQREYHLMEFTSLSKPQRFVSGFCFRLSTSLSPFVSGRKKEANLCSPNWLSQ